MAAAEWRRGSKSAPLIFTMDAIEISLRSVKSTTSSEADMATTIPQDWRHKAESIDGSRGPHERLIAKVEKLGFVVEPDDEEKELTFFARPGNERFAHRLVGEIRGGRDAVVTVTVAVR
jgi:hypothetical protein